MGTNSKSKTNVQNEPSKNKRPKNKRTVLNNIIIVFLCLVLLGGVTGFFLLSNIVSKVSDIDKNLLENLTNTEPSVLFDNKGKKYSEIGAESRELITYEQLPQVTIDAFLAIEDSRYFKHNGFDLPRFISSAFSNLKSGTLAQGGSTLTMQAIDNAYIKPIEEADKKKGVSYSPLKKVELKIQEIYLSMRLDSKASKEENLTFYLNKINFGSSARGIQKGAQYYFGKNVETLNLSESAFLAGVINAPANNNPYKGYNKETKENFYVYATNRRNDTLSQMLNHGYISESEYKAAKSTKLAFQLNGEKNTKNNAYTYYMLAAIEEVKELTGLDPATTPMKIYTALDTTAQDRMDKISEKEVINMPDNKYFQVASVVIDNKTGGITAVNQGFNKAGSSDYKLRATTTNNMMIGSTAKPFLEYALAFENCGWATSRVIDDKKMSVGDQVIVNYDNRYHGKVSLERALSQSLNSPAIQTMLTVINKMGNDKIVKYLENLGFSKNIAEKFDYQYGIGAGNFVASPTQVAGAFATLANGGTYVEPHMVTKVELKDGSKTFEKKPKQNEALSEQSAYMTNLLLGKAVTGKYSNYNYMSSAFSGARYPVYGKTGTSDWGVDSTAVGGTRRDGWMVNYTSEYTIASWNGFDKKVNGYSYISKGVQDMNIPGRINRYILDAITKNAQSFTNPGGLSSYGGGLIKTEFLSSAAKNNPMTEQNMVDSKDKLTSAVNKAQSYDASKYTAESWAALQKALNDAKALLNRTDISEEEINGALAAINSAIGALKEPEKPTVNLSALSSALNYARSYTDTSKYAAQFVQKLVVAVNNGSAVLSNATSTQAQIDAAVNGINTAITNCINNPVVTENPDETTAPNW